MTPELAGERCADLDKCLRGADVNLSGVAALVVTVIRDEAWRRRKIRTGEIVECSSFLELLTAPPLKGYGENPAKVEALLRDDAKALRMFREATTAPHGGNRKTEIPSANIKSDIVPLGVGSLGLPILPTIHSPRGNSRAYTLDRLHREAPELYEQVVAKKLSANKAAIQAGFRSVKTPTEHVEHWFAKMTPADQRAFLTRHQDPLHQLKDLWSEATPADRQDFLRRFLPETSVEIERNRASREHAQQLKDPRSREYARSTFYAWKHYSESLRCDQELVDKELAEIDQYRHWEVLGYPSKIAMLKAELTPEAFANLGLGSDDDENAG